MINLEAVYALWYLHRLKGELLPDIAAALLSDGYETPSLRKLADMEPYDGRAVQELFSMMANELHLPPLSPLAAAILVGKYVASESLSHDNKAKVCAAQDSDSTLQETQENEVMRLPSEHGPDDFQKRRAALERELFKAAREAIKTDA